MIKTAIGPGCQRRFPANRETGPRTGDVRLALSGAGPGRIMDLSRTPIDPTPSRKAPPVSTARSDPDRRLRPVARKPELLAPAGDRTCLVAAIENGADAVYFGLQGHNARARAANFDPAELPEVMDAAPSPGRQGVRHPQHPGLPPRAGRPRSHDPARRRGRASTP